MTEQYAEALQVGCVLGYAMDNDIRFAKGQLNTAIEVHKLPLGLVSVPTAAPLSKPNYAFPDHSYALGRCDDRVAARLVAVLHRAMHVRRIPIARQLDALMRDQQLTKSALAERCARLAIGDGIA